MTPPLRKLAATEGVLGICLHYGPESQWRKLPPSVTNEQGDAMCRAIAASFRNYAIAGRTLKQAYFKFRRHTLLVVASPTHEDGRLGPDHSLTFFVNAHAELPNLIHASRVFLADHAAELE